MLARENKQEQNPSNVKQINTWQDINRTCWPAAMNFICIAEKQSLCCKSTRLGGMAERLGCGLCSSAFCVYSAPCSSRWVTRSRRYNSERDFRVLWCPVAPMCPGWAHSCTACCSCSCRGRETRGPLRLGENQRRNILSQITWGKEKEQIVVFQKLLMPCCFPGTVAKCHLNPKCL